MRVGVVGFGVAGATTSALLAQAGHEVTLFERAPEIQPVGAGVLLQPSGQLVLERLGLLEPVRAGAARIDELVALSPGGRAISRLRYGDLEPGLHALGVHRSDLTSALADLVAAAGVEVRLGQEISGPDDERLREFDLVVGADGSRSALRAGSGLVRWEHEYAWGALWAIGSGLRPVPGGCTRSSAARAASSGSSRSEETVQPLLEHPTRPGGAAPRRGFEAWKAEVAALCPEAAEPLASLAAGRTSASRPTVTRSCDGPLRAIVLVGDAATR